MFSEGFNICGNNIICVKLPWALQYCPLTSWIAKLFEKKSVGTLMEHQSYDCMIDLKEGAQPPFERIYNCHKIHFQLF
jgi:hypothetical protein